MAFILGLLWLAYFYFTLAPVAATFDMPGSATSTPVTGGVPIVIEKGEGIREIAQELAGEQLIRSISAFKLYAILSGNAHQLKPGLYTFTQASSTIEIIRSLVAGPAKEISVLIPEGMSLAEIDATMARYGVLHAGAISKSRVTDYYEKYPFLRGARSLEGFLFPDTYRFYFDSKPEAVITAMLDNFSARVAALIADGTTIDWDNIPITRRGIFNSLEVATIASMIEKEVPFSTDRRIVADIMYRRLKISMPLQIDATRDYAKTHGASYNTYERYGLPPGPIANAGIDAFEAALNPKSSTFLYYLSDPKTKNTIFAKTFEEHKANILKYLP
jgi:UPF0755 protein